MEKSSTAVFLKSIPPTAARVLMIDDLHGREIPGHILAVAHHYCSIRLQAIPVDQFLSNSRRVLSSQTVPIPCTGPRETFSPEVFSTPSNAAVRGKHSNWYIQYGMNNYAGEASIPYRLPAACSFCQYTAPR